MATMRSFVFNQMRSVGSRLVVMGKFTAACMLANFQYWQYQLQYTSLSRPHRMDLDAMYVHMIGAVTEGTD